MSRFIKYKSLGVKLLVAVLAAVLVPSVLVAVILLREAGEREANAEFDAMQAVAEAVADGVEDFVSEAQAVLATASLSHIYWESPTRALQNILASFGYFRLVAVRDSTGRVTSLVIRGNEDWEHSQRVIDEAFQKAIQGHAYTSEVLYTAGRHAALLIAVPVGLSEEEPLGVIAALISLEAMEPILERNRFDSFGYAFLIDDDGRVITYPGNLKSPGTDLSYLPPVKNAIKRIPDEGFDREDIYRETDGKSVIATYRLIPELGWSVVVQQPVSRAFAGSRKAMISVVVWTLFFASLFACLGVMLARRVTGRIAQLRDAAKVMGRGTLSYRIEMHTGDELEELARALNDMAASLEASTRKLESEHARALTSARQASTLYQVSQALVSTIDLERRLDIIAKSLARVCESSKATVWLFEGESSLVPGGSYGLSVSERKAFSETRVSISDALRATLVRQEPMAVYDVREDSRLPEEIISALGVRSALCLPLAFHRRNVGLALVYEADRQKRFTKKQIRLARAIAAQGAVSVENARAYERERRISETLQRAFLPEVPRQVGSFEIADQYESALAEAEVGGDFYDIIQVSPSKLVMVIADVSGKGLSAAVHTAMLKYTVRAYATENDNAVSIVARLNDAVCRYVGGQVFITLFYGVLDIQSAALEYVNAGHELPLLHGERRASCMRLRTTGTALGILEGYEYESDTISFVPGDALLLYTDGATEARRDGKFLGIEGLEEMFCALSQYSAVDIVRKLDSQIREYAGGNLRDDMALLVVKSS